MHIAKFFSSQWKHTKNICYVVEYEKILYSWHVLEAFSLPFSRLQISKWLKYLMQTELRVQTNSKFGFIWILWFIFLSFTRNSRIIQLHHFEKFSYKISETETKTKMNAKYTNIQSFMNVLRTRMNECVWWDLSEWKEFTF